MLYFSCDENVDCVQSWIKLKIIVLAITIHSISNAELPDESYIRVHVGEEGEHFSNTSILHALKVNIDDTHAGSLFRATFTKLNMEDGWTLPIY